MALFLDLDGTLVDIAARPDLVHVPAGLVPTLRSAHRQLGGALAIISGRTIASLDHLLAPLRLPAAGIHGLEYRSAEDGPVSTLATDEIPAAMREQLQAFADTHAGLLLEHKGCSMALHYRGAPALAALVRSKAEAALAELGAEFCLQPGKMVIELRPARVSKGSAIESLMAEPQFRGRRPTFFGDDITDEDGFDTVNRLDGLSVRVGESVADSQARYGIDDSKAVLQWLQTVVKDLDND